MEISPTNKPNNLDIAKNLTGKTRYKSNNKRRNKIRAEALINYKWRGAFVIALNACL